MGLPQPHTKETFGRTAHGTPAAAGMSEVRLRITSVHEFLHLNEKDDIRTQRLNALNHLIYSQADMHESVYGGDAQRLGNAIEARASTFRGFIIHTEDGRPAAYCVYYPMVDSEGRRAAYCEDIYIVQPWRGYGIFSTVLQELARRTISEKLDYVQWSTDARNHDFLNASEKKGIKRAQISKWDCHSMTDRAAIHQVAENNQISPDDYIVRKLTQNDLFLVSQLGYEQDLITNTGDLADFRGYIIFHKDDKKQPVAIVPGWKRLSTFRLVEDIVLEHPRIKDGHDPRTISLAVACAVQNESVGGNMLWHLHDQKMPDLENFLAVEFGAHPETMAGTPESTMLTHILRNGSLKALSEAPQNLVITKRNDMPIGASAGARPPVNGNKAAHYGRRITDPRPKAGGS